MDEGMVDSQFVVHVADHTVELIEGEGHTRQVDVVWVSAVDACVDGAFQFCHVGILLSLFLERDKQAVLF